MKKILIMALMAIMPFGAFAQKFGHFNSDDIIPLMSEYKSAQTELEELKKQYSEELNYMESEFSKKLEDYDKNHETMPDNIRARREQELAESRQKMQEYYERCQIELEQKSGELMNDINNKLQKAVQTVGEEGSYVCIFNVAAGVVPFVSSTLTTDVTEPIKSKLGIK